MRTSEMRPYIPASLSRILPRQDNIMHIHQMHDRDDFDIYADNGGWMRTSLSWRLLVAGIEGARSSHLWHPKSRLACWVTSYRPHWIAH